MVLHFRAAFRPSTCTRPHKLFSSWCSPVFGVWSWSVVLGLWTTIFGRWSVNALRLPTANTGVRCEWKIVRAVCVGLGVGANLRQVPATSTFKAMKREGIPTVKKLMDTNRITTRRDSYDHKSVMPIYLDFKLILGRDTQAGAAARR